MDHEMLTELQNELINAFPSHDIKKWYKTYSPEWTVSQMATLANLYMRPHHLSKYLRKLSKLSAIPSERAYLKSAARDASQRNYKKRGFSSKTQSLYDSHMKLTSPEKIGASCLYECCRLPLGISKGDVISYKYKRKKYYAVICSLPTYSDKNYDISDEWIYAYNH